MAKKNEEGGLSGFSLKNFSRALVLFLVLVACFEVGVTFIPEELSADVVQNAGMRIKDDRALNSEPLDAVILGDSFFFAGVMPAILDRELNIRSFNFATHSVHTYLISYVLFKKIMEHSRRPPGLLILGVHPSSLYFDLKVDREVLRTAVLPFFHLSFDLLNELPMDLKVFAVLHKSMTFIPSINKQYLLRQNLPDLLLHADREKYWRYMKSIAQENGYVNEDLGGPRKAIKIFSNLRLGNITIHKHNDRYIRKILALAQKYGVKAVLVSNSYRGDVAASLSRDSKFNFDIDYFNKLKEAYPNVIAVFDMHSAVPDPDRYVDETHLDNKGAVLFTEELACRLMALPRPEGL